MSYTNGASPRQQLMSLCVVLAAFCMPGSGPILIWLSVGDFSTWQNYIGRLGAIKERRDQLQSSIYRATGTTCWAEGFDFRKFHRYKCTNTLHMIKLQIQVPPEFPRGVDIGSGSKTRRGESSLMSIPVNGESNEKRSGDLMRLIKDMKARHR